MTSDDVTYIDYDPHRVHLPTNAPHVHVRGSGECVRSPGEACLSGEALRARVVELETEVERLTEDIDVCWVPLYHGAVNERRLAEARAESAEAERDALRDAELRALRAMEAEHERADALQQQIANVQRDLLEAETKLAQSVPAYYGWATYDDGSRSDLEWWVKTSDDDWVSLNSERRTTGDIMLEHFSCWPVDGPPHAAGVRP